MCAISHDPRITHKQLCEKHNFDSSLVNFMSKEDHCTCNIPSLYLVNKLGWGVGADHGIKSPHQMSGFQSKETANKMLINTCTPIILQRELEPINKFRQELLSVQVETYRIKQQTNSHAHTMSLKSNDGSNPLL